MIARRVFAILLLVMVNSIYCPAIQHKTRQRQSADTKQRKPKTENEVQQRPNEIVFFINNARSAPPEFAADLLIRIAESDKVADPAWKREILEEAFRLAPQAQQPFKREYTSTLYPIDTRAGFLGHAFGLKLDTLSLECRAVKAMLSIDKQKARALFSEIPKLDLKPISCEESLVYDISDFYNLLTDIAQTAFTSKEIRRKEHLRFVESYISDLVSPAQLEPVVNAILAMKLSRSDLESLVYTFSIALPRISEDPRSFWSSDRPAARAINNLLSACEAQGVATDELLMAYRAYLIKQFNGQQCADTYKPNQREMARLIEAFNEKMRPKSQKNISPILADEIEPLRIEGEEKAFWYWQSPKAAEFLSKIKRLRFGPPESKTPLSIMERVETADWRAEVDDFLKGLAAWHKEDEKSEEDYFHQKCSLYVSLLGLIPPGQSRDYALRSYVTFLDEFDLQRGSRIEWFWHASPLLGMDPKIKAAASSSQSAGAQEYMGTKPIEILETTKSPVLYLYVELLKLAPKANADRRSAVTEKRKQT